MPSSGVAEHVWLATGGNPRSIVAIAHSHGWRIEEWLQELRGFLAKLLTVVKVRNLLNHLRRVLENPDTLFEEPSEELLKLYELLVENNLVTYVNMPMLSSRYVTPNPEIGIGKFYAWQLPAYRTILNNLVKPS